MPTISRFYGIKIGMYEVGADHNPPHFHATYAEHEALINIYTLEVMVGYLPNTAYKLVREWARLHNVELLEMWNSQQIEKLPPLV